VVRTARVSRAVFFAIGPRRITPTDYDSVVGYVVTRRKGKLDSGNAVCEPIGE
jgi:hypothetical protein